MPFSIMRRVAATGRTVAAATATTIGRQRSSSTPLHWDVIHIPGFLRNIRLLLLVSLLGGIFEGARGMIFNVVGARVNVRLRMKLMDALLAQEVGFYDKTRTGDIKSRLSSDTSIVGSAVTGNVGLFLRAIVRAIGVLAFMFLLSWQLTILAFATIPTVSILSKWYGT